MKVLLLSRYDNLGASSRIRSYQYLPYLRDYGIAVTRAPLLSEDYLHRLYTGKSPQLTSILAAYSRRIVALMKCWQYDLFWIEYELFPWLPGIVEMLATAWGVPYLVDYDDAIFHRYDRHPSRLIRMLFGGKIDGVMRRAAMVIVGNEYLHDRAVAAGAKQVEILPTSIDLTRYSPCESASRDLFTIGWIGSPATTHYLEQVREVFAQFCSKQQARVVLVGASDPGWNDIPYECQRWSEASEVGEINRFDVGIMPLDDTPWERGKCGYKLIQYMACGKPVVASPVGVNTRIVEHGCNGYLASTAQDWLQALTTLKTDIALRRRLGAAGRAKVEREFSVQANAPRLAALLRAAAGRTSCVA